MSLSLEQLAIMAFILDGTKQQGGQRKIVPIITLHTSENTPGTKNLALAVFIRGRADYGSYDFICDTYGEILQLSGMSVKVWHAPAVNGFASSLSFVTQAHRWSTLTAGQRKALLESGARAAHLMSRWYVSKGVGPVQARLITHEQANAGWSGFITHAIVQPSDRTDPGRDFPWDEFFRYYRAFERTTITPVAAPPAEAPVQTPAKPIEPTLSGWCVASSDASLHVAPLASSRKVRDVKAGEPLLIARDAEATAWWIQVGDYYIQRKRVEKGNGSAERKLFHGNYPDRPLPVNGTRTTEMDLAWEELLYRIDAHTGSPYSDLHNWLGEKGVAGETVRRLQRFLKVRGYYDGEDDNLRGPKTLRAEKEFLNDQRLLFTPKPPSAMPALRGYEGRVV